MSVQFWIKDILRKSVRHMVFYVLLPWFAIYALTRDPVGPTWFVIGGVLYHELRDAQIEAFPRWAWQVGRWIEVNWSKWGLPKWAEVQVVKLAYWFKRWPVGRPATEWTWAQFRHSLAGWLPPSLLALALMWWLG